LRPQHSNAVQATGGGGNRAVDHRNGRGSGSAGRVLQFDETCVAHGRVQSPTADVKINAADQVLRRHRAVEHCPGPQHRVRDIDAVDRVGGPIQSVQRACRHVGRQRVQRRADRAAPGVDHVTRERIEGEDGARTPAVDKVQRAPVKGQTDRPAGRRLRHWQRGQYRTVIRIDLENVPQRARLRHHVQPGMLDIEPVQVDDLQIVLVLRLGPRFEIEDACHVDPELLAQFRRNSVDADCERIVGIDVADSQQLSGSPRAGPQLQRQRLFGIQDAVVVPIDQRHDDRLGRVIADRLGEREPVMVARAGAQLGLQMVNHLAQIGPPCGYRKLTYG